MYGDSRLSDLPGTHRHTCMNEMRTAAINSQSGVCVATNYFPPTHPGSCGCGCDTASNQSRRQLPSPPRPRRSDPGSWRAPTCTDRHTVVDAKAPDPSIATVLVIYTYKTRIRLILQHLVNLCLYCSERRSFTNLCVRYRSHC